MKNTVDKRLIQINPWKRAEQHLVIIKKLQAENFRLKKRLEEALKAAK